MNSAGLSGGQYRPLTQDQVATIHRAALTILEQTGFTYESGLDEVLDELAGAGCRWDKAAKRIFFPPALVEEQAALAPGRVTLYGRRDGADLVLSDDRVYMGSGGQAVNILDLETGQVRPTVLRDLYDIGRLVDQLDNIHFYLRPCVPHDLPETAYDVNTVYACLKATAKHVMIGFTNEQGVRDGAEMGAILAGGEDRFREKPFISATTCFAISPLKLCTQSILSLRQAVRSGLPVALSSAPMAGSTSPITMAGTLALVHAEELAGLVIGQLTRPGAPLLYGGIPGLADLRTMGYSGGAIEFGMMNAAVHQLAAHVKVPNYNSSGLTDSKTPDAQAGWEKASSTLLAAMGGSNYVHHAAGMLESMLCLAYEQYVIDDEIIGQAGRILAGIQVDPDRLALEAIDRVGPGGNFMTSPHTMKYLRSEYYPGNGVSDRSLRGTWDAAGQPDARDRARDLARRLLDRSQKTHIDGRVDVLIRSRFRVLAW